MKTLTNQRRVTLGQHIKKSQSNLRSRKISSSQSKENIPPNVPLNERKISLQPAVSLPNEQFAAYINANKAILDQKFQPNDGHEYDKEVYDCLKTNELIRQPSSTYFDHQSSIKPRMRAIIVDWLVDVHKKFTLRQDTLFIAVDILDLFLTNVDYDKHNLQRLGCAALLIASKNEDITPPDADDFVFFSRNSFTIKELYRTEAEVLKSLEFMVNPIHSALFVKTFINFIIPTLDNLLNTQEITRFIFLTSYINEITLIDNRMIGIMPSLKAAAVIAIAQSITFNNNGWTTVIENISGYSFDDVKPIIEKILQAIQYAQSHNLKALLKKYSQPEMCCVSNNSFPESFEY